MIPQNLSKDLRDRLATISGHLTGINNMLKDGNDPVKIFIQLKASENSLQKAIYLMLDEVFRKAMAEKIVISKEKCPGNCGYEGEIERFLTQFPNIKLEEVPLRLKEIEVIEDHLKKMLAEE